MSIRMYSSSSSRFHLEEECQVCLLLGVEGCRPSFQLGVEACQVCL